MILGGLSFVILWLFGVDYALFWALIIGVLNYIPYFSARCSVWLFRFLLTVVQFGTIQATIAVAVCLTAAQMWGGKLAGAAP